MDVPLEFDTKRRWSVAVQSGGAGGNLEQELNSPRAVVGVHEGDLGAIDPNGLGQGERDDEGGRDFEDLCEEASGDGGAKDEALGPASGKARIVVRVEVGEEVGDREVAREAEGVDDEAGFGDEFGSREVGRDGTGFGFGYGIEAERRREPRNRGAKECV